MKVIKGNLITMALNEEFDVIAHGCNCFNTQRAGLAKEMSKVFNTDLFKSELSEKGDYNKLGNIEYEPRWIKNTISFYKLNPFAQEEKDYKKIHVVNCYTQYYYLGNKPSDMTTPFDYEAFSMCMKKINHIFKGKVVGLPWIGCGLAKASKSNVEAIMKVYLSDVDLTIVEL